MSRYFAYCLPILFLLHSVPGLLPIRFVPHDHLLLGQVTPAQLRAHEEQEAAEAAGLTAENTVPPGPNLVVTPTGGLIISVMPPGDIVGIPTQLPIACISAIVLLVLEICGDVILASPHGWSLVLPSPNPPPRLATA